MKKFKLLILLLGILGLPFCGGYPVHFTEKAEISIPKKNILPMRLENMDSWKIKMEGKKLIKQYGLSEAAILSAHLKRLKLNITPNSNGRSLAFLESVEFYAEADNLPKIMIAHKDTTTSGEIATLTINEVDLKSYLVAEKVNIFAKIKGNLPEQDTQLEAVFDLEINIDIALSCQEQ
jgi:hypothetical protein